MKFDVIVVGAGPAGSMAALVLARAGKRVLVLEKSTFPRSKVCGYSLNPRCLPLLKKYGLNAGFEQLPHFDIGGFTLELEGRPIIRHSFKGHRSRTVERGLLDQWLAREAEAAGARLEFGTTVKNIDDDRVETSSGDYTAPVIIGADGRNSVVGRLSQLTRPSRPCGRVGWQTFVEAPSLGDHIHMNVFPEGCYGMNRIDDKQINLAMVLFTHSKASPGEIVRRYRPDVVCDGWKSIYPIARRPWEVTNGRAWLVGDAARVLEPMTGEGIYSAVATAEMAAQHILSIDKIGVEAAAANYRRQHRRFYGPRTLLNSTIRWALEDSSRSTRIMHSLKRWPTLLGPVVDWVHKPVLN